jgi:uncharacterized repeat protein (TIGR01451 family)
MTYTLTYGNSGHMHAEGVSVSTTLPPGTTYEGSGWTSGDGETFTFAVGDLLAGDTGYEIAFTVRHGPELVGSSEFETPFTITGTGSAGGDANPADNSAEAYVGVPDLVVADFSVTPMPLQADAPATFTIVIENQGTGMAWNPDNTGGFWIDLFTSPVASYPSQGYGVDYAGAPPLAPGEQYTIVITHTFTQQEIQDITAFYVRVDNEAAHRPYGLVPESDEMNNLGGPIKPLTYIYVPLVMRNSTDATERSRPVAHSRTIWQAATEPQPTVLNAGSPPDVGVAASQPPLPVAHLRQHQSIGRSGQRKRPQQYPGRA